MSHTKSFARRSLLRSLAVSPALSYLLPSLRGTAHAQSGPTKRLLVCYTQHGTLPQFWDPVGVAGAAPTETAWDFGDLLKPLAPFKNDVVLVAGVDMRSHDTATSVKGDGHQQWQAHSLTATTQASDVFAGGISVDQFVVNGIKANAGGQTPTALPSLSLGITEDGPYTAWGHPFYYGASQAVPIEYTPANAFKRLFPSGSAPVAATMGSPNAGSDPLLERRKSVLDFASKEYGTIGSKLGKDDRTKFDAYSSAIRDLETRLTKVPTMAGAGCATPSTSSTNAQRFKMLADVQPRLIQAAFACDLTRVATVMFGEVPNYLSGYTGGGFGTTDSHDLVHKTDPCGNGPLANNAQAVAVIKQYHTVYAQQVAAILKLLKDTPDSNGASLLDNTLVLWAGEISSGNHTGFNVRWVLAGKAGGALKTGRYVSFGNRTRNTFQADRSVPSHNQLFVELANLMDVKATTFGDPAAGTGGIPSLRGS